MAFVEAAKRTPPGMKAPKKNSVSMAHTKKNGSVTFGVARDVWAKMGSPKYVKFHNGTGPHAGMVLITPAATKARNTNQVSFNSKEGQRLINVSPSRIGIAKKFSAVEVPHDLVEEGLVVTLPRDYMA